MPAGDLVVADWQLELRGLLMGMGTTYVLNPPGIKGLGVPLPKASDIALDHAIGSYASPDYAGSRLITVPMTVMSTSASGAMTALDALNTAWAASTADIPLYLRLPGVGKHHFVGRPRGLDEDLGILFGGNIPVLATFVALDPTRITP